MESFRSYLARLSTYNYSYLLILGLVVKALISNISFADCFITVPILGFEAYKLYLSSRQPDPVVINAEVRKELDNIKAKLNAQTLEKGVKAAIPRYF